MRVSLPLQTLVQPLDQAWAKEQLWAEVRGI